MDKSNGESNDRNNDKSNDRGNLEQKFVDYVIKHKGNYYRLAYSYVRNADDALDIVKSLFIKLFPQLIYSKSRDILKPGFTELLLILHWIFFVNIKR